MNIANSALARLYTSTGAAKIIALAVAATIVVGLPASAARSKRPGGSSASAKDDPGCRSCIATAASLFASGKNKEAAEMLREWAPKCPNSSQLQLMLSTVLLRIGADLAEVESAARRAVDADDHSVAARLQLALILTNNNKTSEGVEQLKKVTELDPASYEAWSSLAAAYKVLHEDELAAQAATTAAELEPNTMQVKLSVLRNLRKTGKLDAAAVELKKFLASKSASLSMVQELASEALLIGAFDEAIAASKRVLEKFPDSSAALKMMALAQYCLSDYNATLQVADQMLAKDKANADALAIKGLSLIKLNRASDAEQPVADALAKQPNSSLALLGSGALQSSKGNNESAIEQLVLVLGSDASSAQSQGLPEPLAHLELASIYKKMGKTSAAAEEVQAALHDGRFSKQAQQYGISK